MTSVGVLGKLFSIAILFLAVQRTEANPAKMNMSKQAGKGPLPCNQSLENSIRDLSTSLNCQTSLITLQMNLAKWHLKRIWFTDSAHPQTQQLPEHFHLLIRLRPTCSLLLKACQRKNLIFRGNLHFHMCPATLLAVPLSVKKRYRDLVVNILVLSKAQTTLSRSPERVTSESCNYQICSSGRPLQLWH